MKIKNWKIGSWLLSGFTIILFLVAFLGIITYQQTQALSEQTQIMYNHPLTVRESVNKLQLDMSVLRTEFRNLILADTTAEEDEAILQMELAHIRAENQFKILEDRYLGPQVDIDETYQAFVLWSNVRENNLQLVEEGEIEIVLLSISVNGEEGIKRDELLSKISVIEEYAENKSDELFDRSVQLSNTMTLQISLIVSILFVLTSIIGFWIYRSFKVPLTQMNNTVLDFKAGNMKSRVLLGTTNELGTLATSFDEMADTIETNDELHNKTNDFSDILISENNIDKFFEVVLQSLMTYTESVGSALYLLNEGDKTFEYFKSIGLQRDLLSNYNPGSFEGEFGNVLITKEIQILTVNPKDSPYIYNTVTLGLIPKQIMSIPLIIGESVVGLITLANLEDFKEVSIEFINRILDNLTSRSEAVFATEKNVEFLMELEQRSNELVAQNAELEMQKKQLNEASKLKSNFLSNMSHELRTPLNSVIALSGVLYERLSGQISDEEYSYLEIIGRNGRNLLDLINDILDISRIESGKIEMDITKFSVNSLIEEVLTLFKIQTAEKGIDLVFESKKNSILISSDYDKLKHVLQNLVSNAVKFTKKGNVTVEIEKINSHFQIKVIDTGIGIDNKNLELIFEEFKQAESGTSRRFGGTGLGLSIVKKYISLLEGDISVTSEINNGSTFLVTLPIEFSDKDVKELDLDDNINHKVYEESSNVSSNLDEKTVLLIEDNESAIIQIRELVKGMGIKVEIAENGESGLKMLQEKKIDAIILDLMMPGMDGFGVLEEIRNDDRTINIPVIILTAKHITKQDLKTLKRNNIHQLIQKGDIDRIELQKTIFNMIFKDLKQPSLKISRNIKPRILIVEDNKDNRVTINAVLRDFGELYESVDGEQGVLDAIKYKPDLILMDIALPKKSGIEAYNEIKKIKELSRIPIIAITASALETEKDRILAHGFDGFVAKPIISHILIETIEKVLFNDK